MSRVRLPRTDGVRGPNSTVIVPDHVNTWNPKGNGSGTPAPTPAPTPTPSPSAAAELLLVAGQSLAGTADVSGSAGLPSGWSNTSRVQIWDNAASAFVTYTPASPQKTDPENNNNWGPETAYAAEWLADAANTGKTLYVVKHWQGGSQLGAIATYGKIGSGSMDWAVGTANGNWNLFKNKVLAAKAALAAASVSYTLRDMLWIQGETDSRNAATLTDYPTNAGALYQAVRNQLADNSLRIVSHFVSQYYSDYPRGAMAAQQRAVATANAPAYIIDTLNFGYNSDQIHWSSAGARSAGATAYKLTHGEQYAPGGALSTTGTTVSSAAPAGTFVGHVSASLNGLTTYAVVGNANFTIAGTELRVASGATLAAGTVNLVIRATNAAGTQDYTVPVTVTQAAAGGIFLTDELSMPAEQSLTLHAANVGGAWKQQSGAAGVPAGNAAGDGVYSTVLTCVTYNDSAPAGPDYFVEIEMSQETAITSQTCGVTMRAKSDANTYFYFRYNNAAGAWQLGRTLNGSVTSLGTDVPATITPGQPYVARIQAVGQLIKGFVNGVEVVSATDNSGPTLAGFAGIRMSQAASPTTGWHVKRITTGPVN